MNWVGLAMLLLLIVIVLFPSIWGAKIAANESSAIGWLRKISSAETQYQRDNKGKTADFAFLIKSKYLDWGDIDNVRGGYIFSLDIHTDYFEANAVPVTYNKSGTRSFHLDRAGKIHHADKQGQKATDEDLLLDTDR